MPRWPTAWHLAQGFQRRLCCFQIRGSGVVDLNLRVGQDAVDLVGQPFCVVMGQNVGGPALYVLKASDQANDFIGQGIGFGFSKAAKQEAIFLFLLLNWRLVL